MSASMEAKKTKQCPKCVRNRKIEFFGERFNGSTIQLQSWCKDCRNDPANRKAPEKVKRTPASKITCSGRVNVVGGAGERRIINVTSNPKQVARLYKALYPDDGVGKRSWKFMVEKIITLHGVGCLSPEAVAKLEGLNL